jgi:hypothetical protein
MSGTAVSGIKRQRLFGLLRRRALPLISIIPWASMLVALQMHPPLFQPPVIPNASVSVKTFGAKGDARVAHDGAMEPGSPILRSAGLSFSTKDVGRQIYVLGAGANSSPLDSRITSITDSGHAVLANNAISPVSNTSVAVGDDDSHAIQIAIDTIGRKGGGTVLFPPGTYRIAYGIAVEYSNIRLTGSGPSSTIFESNLVLYAAKNVAGHMLEGGWGPFRAITVGRMRGVVSNVEIDNLQVRSNGDQWIHGSIGQSLIETSPIMDFTVQRFRLHNVTFSSLNFGLFSNGGTLDGFSLDHNVMPEVPKEGFYITGRPSNGIISDNRISTNIYPSGSNIGIALKNGNNLEITNNVISGNFYSCIAAVEFPEKDIEIKGNRCTLGNTSNVADGIVFDHGTNIVVSDNVIEGHRAFGITFRGSDADISNVKIVNNKIQNGKLGPAISIVGTPAHQDTGPSNVTVVNNTLSENPSGIEAVDIKGQNNIVGNTITASSHKEGNALNIRVHPGGALNCSGNNVGNYRHGNEPCK